MAVNTFTFGNVTSSTYGIYVSGEGLFNAPVRSAEVISIPGRNGAYILDEGKFENITVTYRVFNQEKSLNDFRTKLANLRNALCSQIGYQRLTDTFHPNEYRMAAFIDGVEVKPVEYNTASEFEIKFECKPQRFLTSGETAQTITSGSTITNPTLFDARPQLQLWGVGTISLGGNEITLVGEDIGDVVLYEGGQQSGTTNTIVVDDTFANSSDTIDVGRAKGLRQRNYSKIIQSTVLSKTGAMVASKSVSSRTAIIDGYLDVDQLVFAYGTSKTVSGTATLAITFTDSSTESFSMSISVAYDGADSFTFTANNGYLGTIILHSTQTTTGAPAYVDLDIGECYKVSNGSYVSINNAVTMPSKLPTLPSGATTITFDNTFTQVKIVPRWWQV